MKKFAIGFVIALLLMSASSFATKTRTFVMGDNSMVMVDDYNVKMFPGRINNYPDLAIGEFSPGGSGFFDNEFYDVGIHWQFNDDNPWVLGTYISTWPRFGPTAHEPFPGVGEPFLANLEELFDGYYIPLKTPENVAGGPGDFGTPRRIELIYGREISGNDFGFSLEIAKANYKWEVDSVLEEESFSQFTFGAGLTEGTSGQWDIALQFMMGSWTDEVNGLTVTKPNGYYDFSAMGRYFWVQNPKVTFVPHAGFTLGKRGADMPSYTGTTVDYTETIESKRTAFDLGIGMNYTTGPDMLAVADFGIMLSNVKYQFSTTEAGEFGEEEKYNYQMLPYFKMGFEGEVFSWLDVRAGGSTTLWSNKLTWEGSTEQPDVSVEKETFDFPLNRIWLGTGLHFGKLHIDTYTDPEILLDGFNFISGSDDVSNLNWEVSLLYELF